MVAPEFSFRLQHGIAGGFAPPTPNEIHTVTRARDHLNLCIASAVRPDGTPELQSAVPKEIKLTSSDNEALVEELHEILKNLPTEQPPGSEDIYGLDTSIAWGSDDFMWVNGGPQGCGGGTSTVKASEEEKKKFSRAVEIVKLLVNKEE